MRYCIRAWLTLSTILLVSPSLAHAQAETRPKVLSLPEGQRMLCRKNTVAALKMDWWEFYFGEPSAIDREMTPRTIRVAFDSVGHPRMFTDESQDLNGGVAVSAAFGSSGPLASHLIEIEVDSAMAADAALKGDVAGMKIAIHQKPARPLTAEEQTQIQVLADWLWKHRCMS